MAIGLPKRRIQLCANCCRIAVIGLEKCQCCPIEPTGAVLGATVLGIDDLAPFVENRARSIAGRLAYPRSAYCSYPKNLTIVVNTNYNGWRFKDASLDRQEARFCCA